MSATAEQRNSNLQHANEVRLARASLKRRINAGKITAAQVILEPPSAALNWEVGDLLTAQRRWGASRSRRLLGFNRISETRPVGALTARQRTVLAGQLSAQTATGEGE